MPPIPVRPSSLTTPSSGGCTTAHFGDIDEQAAALQGWNQRYLQLSRGAFDGSVRRLQLDGMGLFIEDLHQSVYQAGWVRREVFAIGVPLLVEGDAQFCGRRATQQSLHVFSGDNGFEFRSPQRHVMIGIEIDRALYEAHLGATANGVGNEPHLASAGLLQPDADAIDKLRSLLTGLFQIMSLPHDRSSLVHSLTHSAPLRRQARTQLIDHVVAAMAPQDAGVSVGNARATAAQTALVNKVSEMVSNRLNEAPSIGEICKTMGVSRRTLQNAFQATWGMGPLTWLTTMRLNAVRRRLKSVTQVTEAATEFGFWHFGHFASHYQALFGECPSKTLQRHRQHSVH
ncbi:helix-turn-helix domain-containing protein [Rhodoferax antarcticus]|uniref:Transcriptional regulator, AraC family protein n=1 Tax=Rhodoferax antarcticus ANT.BR TaxID=1111071 RepID=A0A1Q8YCE9_9BURK|nr:helix-turn-helix domain-containing protein [Rhodoferax antarcticus]APW46528.1 hypothetical protein RA876_09255 [Rhodoferax antarcticus]OLP05683.1 transcriptional regulator, AraC family protein [Rhodoferax antarcticus ANT.BR]